MTLIKIEAWLPMDRTDDDGKTVAPLSIKEVTTYFDRWLYGRGYVGTYRVGLDHNSIVGYNDHGPLGTAVAKANHPSNPDFDPEAFKPEGD